jgi:thiol-disulfide isomerase/thioredoxin
MKGNLMLKLLLGSLMLGMTALMAPAVHAESEPTKAINFEFVDVNGQKLKLSDFKGKWVLVNFWAPWCPLCWVEVPTLNELNKRKDFVVIGVGLDYGPDESVVKDTASRHSIEFHAVVAGGARRNPDSPFRQVGPVDFYPTSYIYDPKVKSSCSFRGRSDEQDSGLHGRLQTEEHPIGGAKQVMPEPASAIKEVTFSKPGISDSPAKAFPGRQESTGAHNDILMLCELADRLLTDGMFFTIIADFSGSVAQSVEQRTFNPLVASSSLARPTIAGC